MQPLLIFLAISIVLGVISEHNESESFTFTSYITTNCTNKLHDDGAVASSVEKAKLLLEKHPDPKKVPIKQRLLFMILFSKGFVDNEARVNYLRCALNKLKVNMMPTNTIDIFIWVLKKPGVDLAVPDWIATIPRVNVMEIEPSTWMVPCGLVHNSKWAIRHRFSVDYYLMGRWRLTFSFDFARAMGYAYHMQYDEDSILNAKVPHNVGLGLLRGKYHMAHFSQPVDEIPDVLTGLPELTRYWLTINDRKPVGALFKHVMPHDMDGLTLHGWDKLYYRGFAIATSVDFWFQEDVQDYLTTVLRLGRDIEGRWQEQAVMNMIRLVFVPPNKSLYVKFMDVGHDRSNNLNFYGWCVKGKFV